LKEDILGHKILDDPSEIVDEHKTPGWAYVPNIAL